MSKYSQQLEHIETLLSSPEKSDKSCAYTMLLHLQEKSPGDESLSQLLAESSPTLLPSMTTDAEDKDEEISALALKCLGFMIYFPPTVSKIPGDIAGVVVEMLAGVIITTKMKVICNLAVWCLSIQNLDPSVLNDHSASLIRAIVHSLDNPTGSLSTTFEGTQAIMKFARQIKKVMKDTSSMWGPPLLRRLVSSDKKERDMCQRCLLKVESIVYPPSLPLSKAIFQDMKSQLLPRVHELLKNGNKVQALQAWRWFILILGSHAAKHRHLVNEMLKVPELTFCDQDPQVQVASLGAWESLIDVFIDLPLNDSTSRSLEGKKILENAGSIKRDVGEIKMDRYLKSLKLIMTPLIRITSGQCVTSVRSACLSTWCYLLHKLDIYVNDSGVVRAVVEPILEAVFQIGPEGDNLFAWEFCFHLFNNLIQSKCLNASNTHNNSNASAQNIHDITLLSDKCTWKQYSVRWLPWNSSQLGFLLKNLNCIIRKATGNMTSINIGNISSDRMLRILHSMFKGVQVDLGSLSTSYDAIMQTLKTTLKFVNCIYESVISEDIVNVDLLVTSLQLIKVIVEELDPSLLGSHLYKIEYGSSLNSVGEGDTALPEIDNVHKLDMAQPIVYLSAMYFSLLIHLRQKTSDIAFIKQDVHQYLEVLLSSYNPLEIIHTVVGLLYKFCDSSCLNLWIEVAQVIDGFLDSATNLMPLNANSRDDHCFTICHLFICPLAMSLSQQLSSVSTSRDCSLLKPCDSHVSSQRHTLEEVMRTWKSLYCSIIACSQRELSTMNCFAEDLSLLIGRFLDSKFSSMSSSANELLSVDDIQELNLLFLCGEVLISMLDNLEIRKSTSEKYDSNCKMTNGLKNCFEFLSRVLKLLATVNKSRPIASLDVIPRMLSSMRKCVCRLELREDIHGFMEVIFDALVPWMSNSASSQESVAQNLQLLWFEILACMQRSKPAIIFDSSCLKLHAAILKIVLDHPMPSIRDPTISFWNSTYGNNASLDFPQFLAPVLDKLSREGKVIISNQRPSIYKVTKTPSMNSKRVELLGEMEAVNKPPAAVKRQKRDLTEHQKEVRRAQQGRTRDCGGHGPGIRTYTGLDFSQGTEYEDSQDQESQEIRNAELILDLLKRTN